MRLRYKSSVFFGFYAAICAMALIALSDIAQDRPPSFEENTAGAIMIAFAAFLGAALSHLLCDGGKSLTRRALSGLLAPSLSVVIVCTIFLTPAGVVLLPATMLATGLPMALPGAALALVYGLALRARDQSGLRSGRSGTLVGKAGDPSSTGAGK